MDYGTPPLACVNTTLYTGPRERRRGKVNRGDLPPEQPAGEVMVSSAKNASTDFLSLGPDASNCAQRSSHCALACGALFRINWWKASPTAAHEAGRCHSYSKNDGQEKSAVKKPCQTSSCQNLRPCRGGKERIYVCGRKKIQNRKSGDCMSPDTFQKEMAWRMWKFQGVKISAR